MSAPYRQIRNPNWEEGNGEPEMIPYDHQNVGSAGPSQPNPGSSPQAAQTRRASSAGMPHNSAAASLNETLDDLLGKDVSNFSPESPSVGLPAHAPAGSSPNTGTPSNAETPDDTDSQLDLLNLHAYQTPFTADLDMPDVVPGTGARADRPSWDATVAQVGRLRRAEGMYYGDHIKSFEDHTRFKQVLKHLDKRPNSGHARDMPQDEGGLGWLAERLCNAMLNLDGIESGSTRNHVGRTGQKRVFDSVGVKCVKEMGPFKLEILAWDFIVSRPPTQCFLQA